MGSKAGNAGCESVKPAMEAGYMGSEYKDHDRSISEPGMQSKGSVSTADIVTVERNAYPRPGR